MTLPVWARGIEGKVAVVTGASRGIGRAIAIALAEAGAQVTAVARASDDLEELGSRPGIAPRVGDVLDPGFVASLAERPVDILVNNAGTNQPLPMAEVPVDVLDRMLALNVRSAYLVAQACVRSMLARKTRGVVINMSSQMGHVGSPRRTVYCMTKHAVEGLTKAMAVELAPHGIRVVAVAPTFIETPMTAPMFADPAFKAFVADMIPLGAPGVPDDVASAVVFLASPAAAMITGTSLLVDGGWTAR